MAKSGTTTRRATKKPAGASAGTSRPAATDPSASRRAAVKAPLPTPLTEDYIRSGQWNPLWDRMRSLDPEFMEAYLAFRSVPHRNGPLPPKFKELILIAVNASTTHLYAPGLRRHLRNALQLGATPAEILEVIELTSVLGIHSVNLAVPILCEEMDLHEAAAARPPRARKARAPKA